MAFTYIDSSVCRQDPARESCKPELYRTGIPVIVDDAVQEPDRADGVLPQTVWNRQKDHADFLFIYVREAHPTDGWAMKSNEKAGVAVAQPQTCAERQQVAGQCAALLKPNMPLYVDDV